MRANGFALVQPHIREHAPTRAIIAVQAHGITDLVQRQQQAAPGQIILGVRAGVAERKAFLQHLLRLVTVYAVEVRPTTGHGQPAHTRRNYAALQQTALAPGDLAVVARQAGLGVDHALQQPLREIHHGGASRLGRQSRGSEGKGAGRSVREQVAHFASLVDRGKVQATHQWWGAVAVTGQYITEEIQQHLLRPAQFPKQRAGALARAARRFHGSTHQMPAKAPQEALIGSLQLLQPGIEVLYRTQREGKALHLFPLTGRERGEQFLETVQQVELAHHHVQRQARTQFITQLRQARTQHECQVTSCLR